MRCCWFVSVERYAAEPSQENIVVIFDPAIGSSGGLCSSWLCYLEVKKLSPAVRRDNLLNFPTLRMLADASFPKLHSRVIAVHHLQFPPTREPLPNIGYRGAADTAATILGLHKELCNL